MYEELNCASKIRNSSECLPCMGGQSFLANIELVWEVFSEVKSFLVHACQYRACVGVAF